MEHRNPLFQLLFYTFGHSTQHCGTTLFAFSNLRLFLQNLWLGQKHFFEVDVSEIS